MKVIVVYWVQHYDKELGWKHGQEITITPEEFFKLSESYDVAFHTAHNGNKCLLIDEKGRCFRVR